MTKISNPFRFYLVICGALALLTWISIGYAADGEEATLEDQLNSLNLPTNQAAMGVNEEKFYAVQTRYSPLKSRHELDVGAGRNFLSDSSISSNNLDAGYRFHLNDKWSVGVNYSYVSNDLTGSASRLFSKDAVLPDATFQKSRMDLTVGYNLFYGKFRLGSDSVLYFDNFIELGGGLVKMENSIGTSEIQEKAIVGGVGFAFWMGKSFGLKLGVRDYYHNEPRLLSEGNVNTLIGYLKLGVLFGGSSNVGSDS